jgi:hypothetical protein
MSLEQIWLDPKRNPASLAEYFRGTVGPRKTRLFAVACCRRVQHLLPDEEVRLRQAIDVAERYADRQVKREDLLRAHAAARAALDVVRYPEIGPDTQLRAVIAAVAANAAWQSTEPTSRHYAFGAAHSAALAMAQSNLPADCNWQQIVLYNGDPLPALVRAEEEVQRPLLHDVYGNPTRAATPLCRSVLRWNRGTVRMMAQAIYQERAFHELPSLADALEEAGCSDPDVLAHLRSAGPHVRGCWALDLVLGKG